MPGSSGGGRLNLPRLSDGNSENIPYEIVTFDGGPWLVWQEKDAEVVNQVIFDVPGRLGIDEISPDDFKYQLDE